MSEFYDPRTETPPRPRRARRRQSVCSAAMEALAGGLVIAVALAWIAKWLGF